MEQYTNDLINESSPYLLQHAHNPVDWVPWSSDVFERAKAENKLVLISVGYSACHWCHVMEHESFEDEEVAALMNKFFINVKVDREERPDVDQVYMSAVQLMTQQGGWPLNCFTLPDGRPIHGGTYFPKKQWMHILKSLHHVYTNDQAKVLEFAENMHEGVQRSELIAEAKDVDEFQASQLTELIQRWSKLFDRMEGGNSRAPKFPLPNNLDFLLTYGQHTDTEAVLDHVELTLDKMALGGIYDQVGGGFSRYSVDMLWKVPHFEKMLYDNGQLLYTYSRAYKHYQKPTYSRIVHHTVDWLLREMRDESGAFYAALDADSEGVEGKFYVWNEEEIKKVLGDQYAWGMQLYNINQRGYWEDGNYIPLRTDDDQTTAAQLGEDVFVFQAGLASLNERLLDHRSSRVRPGLDDKCLTSWNAMLIVGLCEAGATFNSAMYKDLAKGIANWIQDHQIQKDGSLNRNFKNGKSTISGFLEDYAHTIAAFVSLFETTGQTDYAVKAKELMDYTLQHFFDENSGMFFFTSSDTELIARKMDINDNVIPASNSVMARNLQNLSLIFASMDYRDKCNQMLANVYDGMEMYGSGYSNWGIVLSNIVYDRPEIVVCGSEAEEVMKELRFAVMYDCLWSFSVQPSDLPIHKDRFKEGQTLIYICTNGVCHAPLDSVNDAIDQLYKLNHG